MKIDKQSCYTTSYFCYKASPSVLHKLDLTVVDRVEKSSRLKLPHVREKLDPKFKSGAEKNVK